MKYCPPIVSQIEFSFIQASVKSEIILKTNFCFLFCFAVDNALKGTGNRKSFSKKVIHGFDQPGTSGSDRLTSFWWKISRMCFFFNKVNFAKFFKCVSHDRVLTPKKMTFYIFPMFAVHPCFF